MLNYLFLAMPKIKVFFVVNFLLVLTILFPATISTPVEAPATNIITDPPTFQWTHHPVTANNPEDYYSGTLEYGEETFNIGGETLTTRAYRQAGEVYTIPGPTLFMQPGKKYVLRFKNLLPYAAPNTEMNVFKDPDITNLHTHGVHISGESPGDDVLRMFEGGFGGDYVYDIPSDHMGGTYWYHAHHHGATLLQVSGGAFGLIIIDDSLDEIPQNVADIVERQLIIGFLDSGVAGTGGDTIMSGSFTPSWTVNGKVNGDLLIPPDTWQHWRILLADADARPKTLEFGPEFEVVLLARDGVWRTQAPKTISTNSLELTGASRADVAVRLSANSSISVDGETVANVVLSGTPDTSVHPYAEDGVSMWSAKRPAYLRNLTDVANVHQEKISMGARTINGEKFDRSNPLFTLTADEVQEWTIKGATQHPFHLHMYHMQVVVGSGEYEEGEFYDTIAANTVVRFDLNAQTSSVYNGTTIMHCHILEHEDQGAMAWANIEGGIGAPTYPVNGDINVTYSEYYNITEPTEPVPNSELAITKANYQLTRSAWDIAGTSTVKGVTITIHIGDTLSGPILATTTVGMNGVWKYKEQRSSALPDATNTISIESSTGAYVLAYPIG